MNKRLLLAVPFSILLLLSVNALSHDYWIEPEAYFVEVGQPYDVRLYLGESLKSESERPLQKERTRSFRLFSTEETEDLLASALDGQTPLAQVTLKRPGNYLIAMERNAATIKLGAKEFEDYLLEEGLDSIREQRRESGEGETEGRERYTRYLKSLLQAGTRRDDTFKRVVGHRLEIIPLNNPYRLKTGGKLKVRVQFDGQPLAGASVFAYNRHAGAMSAQKAISSGAGTVFFNLDRPGQWLVRLVHMRRCQGCEADIDWESFWAAYSFGMR
ncbi:MAG TPA: DUF4198 domain-containing protein [Pyrinomonadaceae bacterium]|jgi:uncharacterized GH25 family protein|nr:DUF4198 domain-containing protein [Pyrinomonadaceae bacterium]